ncbi:MAG TPA: hypothetical protein PK289_05570 [Bacteroidia bacterium]|jgi:hypothetical protein|nr:hypothetical protein [Bacteroidia bacterium]
MRYLNKHAYAFLFVFFALALVNDAYSQAKKNETARFTLYGKIVLDDKPVENVSLEILKNAQIIKKITTTKNGKYSLSLNQDTINRKNEYTIHITKDGTVPKTVVVNTYVPREQYDDTPYEYVLEITLLTTTVNDVIIQRPSARIKWIDDEEGFGIDKVYAKIVQKEEDKLKEDPDKYLKELAKKAKEEEEQKQREKDKEDEKQKAEALARKEEEQNRLEQERQKQESEDKLKENIKAISTEIKTLAERKDSSKATPTQQQNATITPVPEVASSKEEIYDNSKEYELKKDKIKLIKEKQRAEKKKNANLATKYETKNGMSSLLDAVGEHDKRMKNK